MHLDLYIRLGFENNTPTSKEIKLAYRSKSKECHPDLFPGDEVKHTLFLSITEAYEILMNDDKRAEYDNSGFILSNNEERSMRQAAINNIVSSYVQILGQIPEDRIETTDIKDILITNIDLNKDNLATEINKRETTVRKLNLSLSKFKHKDGNSPIHEAIYKVIESTNNEVIEINKANRVLKFMEDILANYDYETITIMQNGINSTSSFSSSNSTFSGFTFRQA
jgi:curved DNA-binding protein CbpA